MIPRLRLAARVGLLAASLAAAASAGAIHGKLAHYPTSHKVSVRVEETFFRTGEGEPGLRAAYFANPDLEGAAAFTRTDGRLRFDWGKNAPSPAKGEGVPADKFSVRWRGELGPVPLTDTYELAFAHDDGMRVWLGGEKILDQWSGPGKTKRRVKLEKGATPKLRVEYRETGGGARARMRVKPLGLLPAELFRVPGADKAGARVRYYGNLELAGDPDKERVEPRVHFDQFAAPGLGRTFSAEWETEFGPAPRDGTYVFRLRYHDGARLFVDGMLRQASWDLGGSGVLTARLELAEGERVPVRVAYRTKPHGKPRVDLEARYPPSELAPRADGRIVVRTLDGETVQRRPVTWRRFSDDFRASIDPLAEGSYRIALESDELAGRIAQRVERKRFAWEGNELGITENIYPPFEPIRVKDDTARVVLRRYQLDGLGLPRSVQARGQDEGTEYRELLAEPVQLRANGERIAPGDGAYVKRGKRAVAYEGKGRHPAVRVSTRIRIELDGCMRVELTLAPGTDRKRLDSLTLAIPMRAERARLFHAVKGAPPIRSNPAGATPSGKGRVWASTQMRDRNWPGNFKPYLWLGGPSRGLAWFADNEKGWVVDWQDTPPCQTLHRRGDVVTLRVHLVQKPVVLDEKRTITFGLMASPAKPMPDDWRAVGRKDARKIHFRMGQLFGLNGVFAAKYPRNKDFSPFEKFEAMRRGEEVDVGSFVNQWAKRNLHDGMSERLRKRFRNLLGIILRHGRKVGRDDHFTAYFEEFRATILWHEEMKTFWSEWTRKFEVPFEPIFGEWDDRPTKVGHLKWFRGTGAAVPSYRDFACYFAAKWLRHGVGIYFDNTFMEPAYGLVNTSAYQRPDGTIQPSAQIWARRKYLRRIWVLHQKLFDPATPQAMMLHMTNSHVLPYMVWNEANLDLEWKLPGVKPLQAKFSPALLRAESLGRQTGNIPMAMVKPGKKGKPPKGMSEAELERIEDTYRAGLAVHEIKYAPHLTTRAPPEPMADFGYGREGTRVVNYWEADPPLAVSDPKCK